MIEQIERAIERQDYPGATSLLQKLMQQEPENPWSDYYVARLQEANGELQTAIESYRLLLRVALNPTITSKARQRIDRITKIEQQQREKALANSLAEPGNSEIGVLILEKISPELKQTAAQKFAKIMSIDPYNARLQLPSRSWRLYRTGKLGELKFYSSSLKKAEIPCFYASLAEIDRLKIYQVNYFESTIPKVTVVCYGRRGQQNKLIFDWQEVAQQVEGLLPVFDASLHSDVRGKIYRKSETIDYVQLRDLHLPGKKIILRLCDRNYQFKKGISFAKKSSIEPATTRINWNNLNKFLQQNLSEIPLRSDFTPFAETAIDFEEILRRIEPNINLLRREDSFWDAAFELYSGLIFLRNFQLH